MRPGVFLGDLGCCPGVSGGVLGNQTDLFNLVQFIAFTKNLLYFLSNQHLQSSRPYK